MIRIIPGGYFNILEVSWWIIDNETLKTGYTYYINWKGRICDITVTINAKRYVQIG